MKPRIFKHDDRAWVLEWEGWTNGFRSGCQWATYASHRQAVMALRLKYSYGMVRR